MALSGLSNANFASGFTTGYGLVGTSLDRQMKREQLEQDQLNKERDYALKEEEADALKEYRASDLLIKGQKASLDAEIQRGNLGINQTKSKTASIQAATAKQKQDDLNNPDSLAYQSKQADLDKAKLEQQRTSLGIKQDTAEYEQSIEDRKEIMGAKALSKIFQTAVEMQGKATTAQLKQFGEEYIPLTKGTYFDIGHILSQAEIDGHIQTRQFLTDLSNGMNPEMTNDVTKAYSTALNLENSAAVGRKITPEFINAPEWMQKEETKIVSQGLYNATGNQDGTLTGSLFVWTEDKNGRQYPYFPPLTANRNNRSNKPLELKIDDVGSASAARAHMVQTVIPAIKPLARDALVLKKYGKDGDNGEEAFQEVVNRTLKANLDGIFKGSNTQNFFAMSGDFSKLPAGTQLSTTQIAKMKRDIEEELLFGVKAEPDRDRVDRWFESTSELLKSAPYTSGDSEQSGNLLSLITEEKWSPQILSNLQGYYDEDSNGNVIISDQEGLTRFLTQSGYLRGTK